MKQGRAALSAAAAGLAKRAEEYARGFWMGGTLFEELGFYYVGPIDGHNLDHLIPVLENVRDIDNGPVLVHVVTKKGKGYAPAEKPRPTNITVSRSSTWSPVNRRRAPPGAAQLHQGVCPGLDPRSGARREGRGDHGSDAVGHGARSFRRSAFRIAASMSASPSSTP